MILIKNIHEMGTTNVSLDTIGILLEPTETVVYQDGLENDIPINELNELISKVESDDIRIGLGEDYFLDKASSIKFLEKQKGYEEALHGILLNNAKKKYKLYNLVCPTFSKKPIFAINFKTELMTSLYYDTIIKFGRTLKVTYYSFNQDGTPNYDDPIVVEAIDYDLDNNNYVRGGTKKFSYYLEDGSLETGVKIMPFYLKEMSPTQENRNRRRNILEKLKTDIVGLLTTEGRTFEEAIAETTDFYLSEVINVQNYLEIADNTLVSSVSTNTAPFLDETITILGVTFRQYILSIIDYWSAEAADPDLYKGSLL